MKKGKKNNNLKIDGFKIKSILNKNNDCPSCLAIRELDKSLKLVI